MSKNCWLKCSNRLLRPSHTKLKYAQRQGWPSLAESRSRDSHLAPRAEMSLGASATRASPGYPGQPLPRVMPQLLLVMYTQERWSGVRVQSL